ncbi:MAG TPA: hypothetical protein VD998_01140 [Verrucomicrobiae bacterium]|nr:hypothetical protein [Verrucomicrobiae bacterium]
MTTSEEKRDPRWLNFVANIFLWLLIIGALVGSLYYKWNHPDKYEPDIEHR